MTGETHRDPIVIFAVRWDTLNLVPAPHGGTPTRIAELCHRGGVVRFPLAEAGEPCTRAQRFMGPWG